MTICTMQQKLKTVSCEPAILAKAQRPSFKFKISLLSHLVSNPPFPDTHLSTLTPENVRRGAFAEADLAYVFEAEDTAGEGVVAPVKGSYSTKVTSLVRGVMRLPDDEKCIIFSEWDDMLELISRALDENSIAHQRCKGGKAVSKGVASFRSDPGNPVVLRV
jgi:SNF2 family DNA or RNA helicase